MLSTCQKERSWCPHIRKKGHGTCQKESHLPVRKKSHGVHMLERKVIVSTCQKEKSCCPIVRKKVIVSTCQKEKSYVFQHRIVKNSTGLSSTGTTFQNNRISICRCMKETIIMLMQYQEANILSQLELTDCKQECNIKLQYD